MRVRVGVKVMVRVLHRTKSTPDKKRNKMPGHDLGVKLVRFGKVRLRSIVDQNVDIKNQSEKVTQGF
jgi:hypothetical protein